MLLTSAILGISQAQPSEKEVGRIISKKIKNVVPESIIINHGETTLLRKANGTKLWQISARYLCKTDIGVKEENLMIHFDKNYEFIKYTLGKSTYLKFEDPHFKSIEKVLRKISQYFMSTLDENVKKVNYIKFDPDDNESIKWSGGGKEVTLIFRFGYIVDITSGDDENWIVEQKLGIRFFKERIESLRFLDYCFYISKESSNSKNRELVRRLTKEETNRLNLVANNHTALPRISWN